MKVPYYPLNGNSILARAMWDRALELGWRVDGGGGYFDKCKDGTIFLHYEKIMFSVYDESELINLNDFFTTDRYRLPPKAKTVVLNTEYTATVHKNGTIEVGCQKFTVAKAEELVAAYKELNR